MIKNNKIIMVAWPINSDMNMAEINELFRI